MPFVDDTKTQNDGLDPQAVVPPELTMPASSLHDIAQSFLRSENTVGSVANQIGANWDLWSMHAGPWGDKVDPNYDPFSDAENLSVIQDNPDLAHSFSSAQSPGESFLIRRRIAQEQHDQETMAQGGAAGTALMFGMGALDPVNLLPVGTAFRAWKAGGILKGATEGAVAGFASSMISEPILSATQETRTPEESLINIAAATVLSGALGGGMGLLHPVDTSALAQAFKADLQDAQATFVAPEGGGGAGGSQRAEATTLTQETRLPMLGEKVMGAAVDIGARYNNPVGNPLQQLLNSPAVEVRRIVQKLAENPLIMRGATQDIAAPVAVTTRFKMLRAGLARSMVAVDEGFNEHRFGSQIFAGRFRAGVEDFRGGDPNKLTYTQFKERVARALRNGDEDFGGMKEVTDTAKKIRPFLDELKDKAIKANLLPEDIEPKTAASYLTRVYLVDKIASQRPEFERIAQEYLAGLEDAKGLDKGDIELIARDITDKILGNNGSELVTFDLEPNRRGAAKERTFLIPDAKIEAFLDNDVARVLHIYHRKFGADVELATTFGRADMRDQITEIADAYARVRNSVTSNTELSDAAREKHLHDLQVSLERDLKNIAAIRDRIRGRYGIPENPMGMMVRVGRWVKALNYTRLMGGVMPGSIPDVGAVAGYHGMHRLMHHGLLPLINNLKMFKMLQREMELAGAAVEKTLDNRAMSIADIGEDYGRYTGAEKALKYAADKFGLINVSSQWNHFIKSVTGAISQTRTLEACEALVNGKATQKEITRLHFLGIDRNMAERIHYEYRRANFLDPDAQANSDYWLAKAGGDAKKALELADKFNADDPLWKTSGSRQNLEHGGRVKFQNEPPSAPAGTQTTTTQVEHLTAEEMVRTEKLREEISAIVDKMAPEAYKGSTLALRKIRTETFKDGSLQSKSKSTGFTDLDSKLIAWSLESRDPKATARHEVIHAIRDAGLLTGHEWAALEDAAVKGGWMDKNFGTGHTIAERYPHLSFDQQLEEAIAEQFGIGKGDLFKGYPESVRAVFLKLHDMLQQVAGAVRRIFGQDASASDIMRMIESGDIAKRPSGMPGQRYDRTVFQTDHGQGPETDGLRFANTERWSDREAVDHFRAALVKETDATIIAPGEEKPLWMSTEWGGVLGQFRSFTLASMLRVTAAGLQRRDVAALQGMIMMTSLGMLAYFLKVRPDDIEWDKPQVWIKEGVDRGGVLGWLFEADNIWEKISGGRGVDYLIGAPASRYAGRGPLSALAGPSVGLGEDAVAVLNNIAHGKVTATDMHKLRKMLPFQNIFWLRYLVDQVERGAVDAAGLPPRVEKRSD